MSKRVTTRALVLLLLPVLLLLLVPREEALGLNLQQNADRESPSWVPKMVRAAEHRYRRGNERERERGREIPRLAKVYIWHSLGGAVADDTDVGTASP